MRKLPGFFTIGLAVFALVVLVTQLSDQSETEAADAPRLVAAFGIVEQPGADLVVHVTVYAPRGVPSERAIEAALSAQGARAARPGELESANFVTTGLVWDQFSDGDAANDFVVQNYNPASEPLDGETVLLNTHDTWNSVATSSFTFSYGGTTTRCPSLVDECPGPQTFDGFNDVAYMSLSGPCNAIFGCTLGVTWFSTEIDEADMALNTKVSWVHDCVSPSGNTFDAETVTLHENGHVLGLGHTDVNGAVMEAFYGGANCGLHQDDVDGVSFLYPSDGTPESPTDTPVPSDTPTDTPVPSDTPEPTDGPTATPTPDDGGPSSCPPGWQRRGLC